MKNASPFVVGLVLILIIGIIMQIPFDDILLKYSFSEFQIEYIGLTLKMSMILIVAVIGIKKLYMYSLSGLSNNYRWASKAFNLIPAYLFLIGIASFIGKDLSVVQPSNLLLLFIACLAVGFAEEFLFRGFLQPLFIDKYLEKKKGIFLGILFPALFFGASHLLNLTVNDNVPQVVVQSIYAVFIGFFFGVLLLKTNKLMPLAITHGLINFFFLFNFLPNLNSTTDSTIESQVTPTFIEQIIGYSAPLIMFLPLFIIGILILKKIKKERVHEKLEK